MSQQLMNRQASRTAAAAGSRRARIAGAVYVLAWLAGLAVAPSAPEPSASAAAINAYYLSHNSASLLQSLLVHGVAGAALMTLAVTMRRVLQHQGAGSAAAWAGRAGVAAAIVSFV